MAKKNDIHEGKVGIVIENENRLVILKGFSSNAFLTFCTISCGRGIST